MPPTVCGGCGRRWSKPWNALPSRNGPRSTSWRASKAACTPSTAHSGSFPRFSLPGDAWLKSTERLENAAEMQIDGAIYVRFVDGSLRKFVGGAAVPFALSGLPADGAAPILTAIGTGSGETLLAADRAAGRILALGPDGAWRATLLRAAQPLEGNPDGRFSALSGLAWDRATGRLFILEGRSLYKASLPKLP